MNSWYLFVFVLGKWSLIGECPSLELCTAAAKSHHEGAVRWMERDGLDVRTDAVCKPEKKVPRMLRTPPSYKGRIGESLPMEDMWPLVYTDLRGGREACPHPSSMTIGEITPLYRPSKRGVTEVGGQAQGMMIWFTTVWNNEYDPPYVPKRKRK